MKKSISLVVVSIVVLLSNPLLARPKLVKDVGISAGIALPQGGWDPGYTLQIQSNFGEVLKYLFLSPYIYYSSAQKSEKVMTVEEDLSIQHTGFGVKLFGFINPKPQGPYFGGALNFNYISYETLEYGQISHLYEVQKNSTTKIGLTAIAGYKFAFKKYSLHVEVNYAILPGGFNNLFGLVGANINL